MKGGQMIKVRLYDGGLYNIKTGSELITIRRTEHGDLKEVRYLPHTYPELISGTKVIVEDVTLDNRGVWLKCKVPSGVIYKLNPLHLSLGYDEEKNQDLI